MYVIGLAAAVMLVVSATACIFDQGSYKEGGRLDTAATGKQDKSSSSSSGDPLGDDDDDTTPPVGIDSGSIDQ